MHQKQTEETLSATLVAEYPLQGRNEREHEHKQTSEEKTNPKQKT